MNSKAKAKVVQYLTEAHATEQALTRTLQAHIAMTPSGRYRTALERHVRETKDHAERVRGRLDELGEGRSLLELGLGVVQGLLGQVVALSKGPLDLTRGDSGEEKLLKNAKDECASEALEIATYLALEDLAREVGDEDTAKLAASIRKDEERMLERLREIIPSLTRAVVAADVEGKSSYDVSRTPPAQTARAAGRGAQRTAKTTARKASSRARSTARQARKVPGVAQAEGEIKGFVASEQDLAIADYDKLNVEEIVHRLGELSQIDLAKVDAYERKHDNRATVIERISHLRGEEPWPGYDEQTVADIGTALQAAGEERVKAVREYERRHKDRHGVMEATEKERAK